MSAIINNNNKRPFAEDDGFDIESLLPGVRPCPRRQHQIQEDAREGPQRPWRDVLDRRLGEVGATTPTLRGLRHTPRAIS